MYVIVFVLTQAPTHVQRVSSSAASDVDKGQERNPGHWLVVAGWEGQDLSTAGRCAGLDGPRSRTFWDLVRVLGALQPLSPNFSPAYLLLTAPMQHHSCSLRVRQDGDRGCRASGLTLPATPPQTRSRGLTSGTA